MTKNYLVIGASSGIGEAIASQLQREGHQVFSASRNTPKVEGVIQPQEQISQTSQIGEDDLLSTMIEPKKISPDHVQNEGDPLEK